MNAPWRTGTAGMRDAFNAFVCDETTNDLVRQVVGEMGWPPEKVMRGGLRNAIQTLSIAASPNILLVDLSESGDPINDINALAEVCEPGTVVIAAGQVNDVRLYRDLIASGIQDYLLKPISPDALRDVISHAQAVFSAPRTSESHADHTHHSVAVIGSRGGVGASTVATSLGWMLAERSDKQTALLDLDVHFGTAALTMDLEPGRGLTDAIENPSRIDGLFIERALVRASEKFALLSAEAPISQPVLTDGSAFFQLLEEFKSAFECTVIDLPRHMLIQYPHLLGDVGATVLVTELTLAAARDAIRLLSWLRSNAPATRTIVVANRVQSGTPEISRKDFEQSIERKIDYCLPLDIKNATQAAKLGKPLADVAKGTKIDHALVSLVADIMGPDGGHVAAGNPSLLGKIGELKALLPSKTKKGNAPA